MKTDLQKKFEPGFTLIEMAIYLAILTILGMPLVLVFLGGSRSMAEADAANNVRERNRVALFRISQDLRRSFKNSIVLSDGGKYLRAVLPDEFGSGTTTMGPVIHYGFQSLSWEALSSADQNTSGTISEGQLVRVNRGMGERSVLCGGIDLKNSSFSWDGDAVTINLTSFGSLPEQDKAFTVTNSTKVYPRN